MLGEYRQFKRLVKSGHGFDKANMKFSLSAEQWTSIIQGTKELKMREIVSRLRKKGCPIYYLCAKLLNEKPLTEDVARL